MNKLVKLFIILFLLISQTALAANPKVKIETSEGVIEVELLSEKSPITVRNFLSYVDSGFYDGTIFHRVIPNFMVQGGGFNKKFEKKQTNKAIKNEADNNLVNIKGTIAMARTSEPHSATAQFFINTNNNYFLNHRSKNYKEWGYTVFGKVTKGYDIVEKIESVKTGRRKHMKDVPSKTIEIIKITQITQK
ncbi:MAG: peptidylprolyl isomerase [Gammaproteobacteria bacterium]|nr:peptidylprolyl isomerase [Gammaproteobacteria bacterium]